VPSPVVPSPVVPSPVVPSPVVPSPVVPSPVVPSPVVPSPVVPSRSNLVLSDNTLEQPSSKYNTIDLFVSGKIAEYTRGEPINMIVIQPDGKTIEQILFATSKGQFKTKISITHDSQIGTHKVLIRYQESDIASKSFTINDSEKSLNTKIKDESKKTNKKLNEKIDKKEAKPNKKFNNKITKTNDNSKSDKKGYSETTKKLMQRLAKN
jgi:hypothetical protein